MADEPSTPSAASELGGTVAFLFSDVEGSTELLRRLGDDYSTLITSHHALLIEVFDAHGGRVVDSQADSFFARYGAVADPGALAVNMWTRYLCGEL